MTKYYAVSHGDGNDGVSQLFPDYLVKTDDPWKLAEQAVIALYKPEYHAWILDNVFIDGEEDFIIYATLYESFETQKEREYMQERLDRMEDCPEADQLALDIENFGTDYAELVIEVYPWHGDLPHCPIYDSLEEAFV